MGSADEVNIQASELNRTMKVAGASPAALLIISTERSCGSTKLSAALHNA